MLSLRTTSPLARQGEHHFHIENLPSPSKAPPQSPIDRINVTLKQEPVPHVRQDPRHHGRVPGHDTLLSTHSKLEARTEQDTPSRGIHSPNALRIQSLPPVSDHNPRQSLVDTPSVDITSRSGEKLLPSALSQYHQSMGNNASTMLRKSRSKIFREQADSPETTVRAQNSLLLLRLVAASARILKLATHPPSLTYIARDL